MSGRVYTVKPNVITPKRLNTSAKAESISLKERFSSALEGFLLLFLSVLFFLITFGIAYKGYLYIKIKKEKARVLAEKMVLEEELNRLTSREVLLEKARKLGLREPKKEEVIYLK